MNQWNPATEVELAMHDALAAADQELYFRILAQSDLLLPVSADAIAGRIPMGWGTWTTGNRTHILAFTSPGALSVCLNDPGGTYRMVGFQTLAAEWPNVEWWLAINPGLPIEAYLPSWFVTQLTRGEVRLPGRTHARSRMAAGDFAATAAAAAAQRSRFLPAPAALPSAPAARPTPAGPTPPPYERAPEPPRVTEPPRPEPARPEPARPESSRAESARDESARAESARAESSRAPAGPAYPPPAAAAPWGAGPRTSPAETIEAEIIETPPAGSPRAEPGPAPRPRAAASFSRRPTSGRPTSGRPTSGRSNRDTQDAEIVTATDTWVSTFQPANDTEVSLLASVDANNTDAFLSTLLLAQVLVPVPAGTPASARPRDPDFPWQREEADGRPFIAVYTSRARLTEHKGADATAVTVRFTQLIEGWPGEEVGFSINPGAPVGATLPGSQIVALAAWARQSGLRDDLVTEMVQAAKKSTTETAPSSGVAGSPTIGADRAILMQRTVPPAQLPFYLERGYDRVSGFVNRASEVAHLTSPRMLYRALGLVYPGSPFAEDDKEVHVLRWVAHRADLYRLPYGGAHEAAMRAMQGWVIERSPFRGNGFAPGDTDVVAEFKVDSVRLPHGAQMWRLNRDMTEALVATFDADQGRWVPSA